MREGIKISVGISIAGLLIGLLVGLTGVGAASLLTPFLVLFGIHPTIAVGTDLVYNSITKVFGVFQHWRQKTIDFKFVKYLSSGSIPGAIIAIVGLHFLGNAYLNEETIIKHALGYVMVLASIGTLIRVFFDNKLRPNRWQIKPLEEKKFLTFIIGLVFGFIVGLTSIGSGSLFALAMLYLYKIDGPKLIGTDITHAFLLATVAGLLNVGFGHVNYELAVNLLIGSIPGVLIGSKLSIKVPAKPLRAVMGVLILIAGLKLI